MKNKSICILVFMFLLASMSTANVIVGHTFTLTLEANHTTGYLWSLAVPIKKDDLRLIDCAYITDKHAENMVGVGGREEWLFKALRRTDNKITFKLTRPWEKNVAPIDIKTFEVRAVAK